MSDADFAGLCTVLLHTFEPDAAVRQAAEKQLENMPPGGHALLLRVVTAQQVPFPVRQAASLRLKNLYQGHWSVVSGENCKISELDRVQMREHILEAVVQQAAPLLRVQLLQVVYYLWPSDAPEQWANLVPQVVHNIQAGMQSSPPDLMRVYGSICALRMVFKRYQYREMSKRAPVDSLVEATFPLLLALLQSQLNSSSEESREMCRIVVKIFFLATTISIPAGMAADFAGKCAPWFECLCFLLEQPLPQLDSTGGDAEKLRTTPAWKTKKWVAAALLRIYNRFGRPDYVGQGQKQSAAEKNAKKAWARSFETGYATRILGAFMTILRNRTQGQYVTERVLHQAFTFVSVCIGASVHYKLLKPALPFLLQESILQQLQLTPADLHTFKHDPQEYIRRSLDLMTEFQDPRLAATSLMFELVQTRTRDTLQLTLSTITHVFETYEAAAPQGRNYVQKEAAMRMFGSLKRLLLSKAEFKAGCENLLVRHVLPEFASPHGFLRQRAAWCIRKYSKLTWTNEAAQAQAVRCCVEGLRDPDMPVALECWESLSYLIDNDKVFEFIRPNLPLIIDQFFKLYEEIGNERVVGVLSTLIERFQEDVTPYAMRLVEKLVEMFLTLVTNTLGDGTAEGAVAADFDDADDGGDAIQPCIQSINAILYACESQPELYPHLLQLCHPIMQRCINEDCIEVYEDLLDMVSVFTYFTEGFPGQTIPDSMWQYLPRILASFHVWASDFLNNMLSVFDNFVARGGEQLCAPQGQPLLLELVRIIEVVLGDAERIHDGFQCSVLADSLMANLRGKIDPVVPRILSLAASKLLGLIAMEEARAAAKKAKAAALAAKKGKKGSKGGISKGAKKGRSAMVAPQDEDDEEEAEENEELLRFKFALLDNIGVGAHYNPLLFVQWMTSLPTKESSKLFNVWLSYLEAMEDDFDAAKNAVLGLSSLALLPLSTMPPLWQQAMPTILNKVTALLAAMSTLLAEDEKEGNKGGEDDEAEFDKGTAEFHDVPEDKDVYHASENDDDDSIDADDDDADDDTGMFMDDMEQAMLGDQDRSKFASPLDDIDAFVFFMQAIEAMSKQEPAFYQQWIASIGKEGTDVLAQHAEQAKQHAQEMAEDKAKDAAEKAEKEAKRQQRQQQQQAQ